MTAGHDLPGRSGDDREESEGERLDRRWAELLQELRVMQTGAQLTAGFLLTLPFTQAFDELDDFQRSLYLGLVLTAGVTTVLVLTPVAAHRRVTGRQVKERLVAAADRVAKAVLALVGALVVGIVLLVFDLAVGRVAAGGVAAGLVALVVALMVWLPGRLVRRP